MRKKLCTLVYKLGMIRLAFRIYPAQAFFLTAKKSIAEFAKGMRSNVTVACQQVTDAMHRVANMAAEIVNKKEG